MAIHSRLSQDRIYAISQDSGLSDKAKDDLITELPGLTVDINELSFSMFSGYLTIGKVDGASVDTDKEIFYWYVPYFLMKSLLNELFVILVFF